MGGTAPASVFEGLDLTKITEEQAKGLYAQGEEVVIFALLELAALAKTNGKPCPSTPSSQIPPYQKDNSTSKKGKKPGRKKGHKGARRNEPEHIDREEEHPLDKCSKCGGLLGDPSEYRTRIIEDIPETKPECTKHIIPRGYCKDCKKLVEPPVTDALPGASLGHRVLALAAWLHYCLGNTLSQVTRILDASFQCTITQGGLLSAWYRMAGILYSWYEEIHEEALLGAKLHADETGYRMHGNTQWLWCFSNDDLTYYMIHASRGEEALREFFAETFDGILITDFWGPYDKILGGTRQKCLPHLFRELEKVDKRNKSPGWVEFRNKLKRLLKDALRLWKRSGVSPKEYASKRKRLDVRLKEMSEAECQDADAKRLTKRLKKYRNQLFTFLDEPNVPPDNNHAEREVRPAVLMRKNSFHNMSEEGAAMQAIYMTIFRTLERRGHNPADTVVKALEEYVATGELPPLPKPIDPDQQT
jgi:transposase